MDSPRYCLCGHEADDLSSYCYGCDDNAEDDEVMASHHYEQV